MEKVIKVSSASFTCPAPIDIFCSLHRYTITVKMSAFGVLTVGCSLTFSRRLDRCVMAFSLTIQIRFPAGPEVLEPTTSAKTHGAAQQTEARSPTNFVMFGKFQLRNFGMIGNSHRNVLRNTTSCCSFYESFNISVLPNDIKTITHSEKGSAG